MVGLAAALLAVVVIGLTRDDQRDALPAAPTAPASAVDGTAATVPGATTAPGATAPTGTAPGPAPSTSVQDAPPSTTEFVERVDLPAGVVLSVPAGYGAERVGDGIEITNGDVLLYTEVGQRPPGEDPVVALQEYVDSFDGIYDAAVYSQTVPTGADTTGPLPVDGYVVHYRVLDVDGRGYRGVLEVTRRADGLVYVSDLYVAIDHPGEPALPAGTFESFYASFLSAPAVGPAVELPPLGVAELRTVHPRHVIDGAAAVAPPPGWAAEVPEPGRATYTRSDGARIAVARIGDATEPAVAQQLAAAEIERMAPGATLSGFTPVSAVGSVAAYDTALEAVAFGVTRSGTARLWVDTASGAVVVAVADAPAGVVVAQAQVAFVVEHLHLALAAPR